MSDFGVIVIFKRSNNKPIRKNEKKEIVYLLDEIISSEAYDDKIVGREKVELLGWDMFHCFLVSEYYSAGLDEELTLLIQEEDFALAERLISQLDLDSNLYASVHIEEW